MMGLVEVTHGKGTVVLDLPHTGTEFPPWNYDRAKIDRLRTHLKSILTTLADWRPT